MSKDEAESLLLDSGLDLDADDLKDLSSTIELLTSGGGGADDRDESEEIDDGSCELCERLVNRTFHHLVPKETHSKYLSRGTLPENLVDVGECTKTWLSHHGAKVCRACHNAIHSAESNESLARDYNNTVELLLAHPNIRAFAKYNSKQPVRNRLR